MTEAATINEQLLSHLPKLAVDLSIPIALHDRLAELRQQAQGRVLEVGLDAVRVSEADESATQEATGQPGGGAAKPQAIIQPAHAFDAIVTVGALSACRDLEALAALLKSLLAAEGQLLFFEPEVASRNSLGLNADITLRLWRQGLVVSWVNRFTNQAVPRGWLLGRRGSRSVWRKYCLGAAIPKQA